MTDRSTDGDDNPPNGIPFLDVDESEVTAYESGEFRVSLQRTDGEMIDVTLDGSTLESFEDVCRETRVKAAEHPEIDYNGN